MYDLIGGIYSTVVCVFVYLCVCSARWHVWNARLDGPARSRRQSLSNILPDLAFKEWFTLKHRHTQTLSHTAFILNDSFQNGCKWHEVGEWCKLHVYTATSSHFYRQHLHDQFGASWTNLYMFLVIGGPTAGLTANGFDILCQTSSNWQKLQRPWKREWIYQRCDNFGSMLKNLVGKTT